MFFETLIDRLVLRLREQLRNGDLTERGLARRCGLSQPHVHNVLKGARVLTPEVADSILRTLRLSVLDLLEPTEVEVWLAAAPVEGGNRRIACLAGSIGPGCSWNPSVDRDRVFTLPAVQVSGVHRPAVARTVPDQSMLLLAGGGRIALLDMVEPSTPVAEGELYIVGWMGQTRIRRAVRHGDGVTFACDLLPAADQRPQEIPSILAKVVRVWSEIPQGGRIQVRRATSR